jgi:predicted RNase H-like HicB family nuclease
MSKTRAKSGRRRRSQSPKDQARKSYRFPVIIEKDEDGYFAACPALQGCYTQGDTFEEALKNIEEAVGLHVEARLEAGEPIPSNDLVSLTTVEVKV